jgi:hypothetical protein
MEARLEQKNQWKTQRRLIGRVKKKFIALDDPTPCFLDASDELRGHWIQNGPSDEPMVLASVHPTP